MSRLDRLKSEAAFLERLFFIDLATIIAMTGWLASSYQTADWWLVGIGLLALLTCAVGLVFLYNKLSRTWQEIDNEP